jgi:hypothetical protein
MKNKLVVVFGDNIDVPTQLGKAIVCNNTRDLRDQLEEMGIFKKIEIDLDANYIRLDTKNNSNYRGGTGQIYWAKDFS